MIDLKTVKEIRISEGSVTKITDSSGVVLWQKAPSSSLDVDLNNQWVESTKTLDGYKVYMSNSNHNVNNGYASMKFKFKGMPDFKLWINSYAESSFDYTVAYNLDVDYPTSNPSSSTSGVKANTQNKQYNPTSISNFTEVDYSNDGGEHFVVVTYRKDSIVNANDDRGYVAVKLTLISTTWVVSATEFIKKEDKYYEKLTEVATYEGGVTALTGNYKEGNELPITTKQGSADDYMIVGSNKYYKLSKYVTINGKEVDTGEYTQGDLIGPVSNTMKVKYVDDSIKEFTGLTTIKQDTDPNKVNAKEVQISEGITSIDGQSFYYCSNLTGITIPNSVISIEHEAFVACSSLTGITIPNSVTRMGYSICWGCSNLKSAIISASVTYIGSQSFQKCSSLTTITIPNSVTKIENNAFEYCSKLESVTIQNSSLKLTYNSDAFANISSTAKLFVPSNLLSEYQSDSSWKNAFKGGIYEIPIPAMKVTYVDGSEKTFNNLTNIGSDTDANKSNAKEVIIYNTVTTIGQYAFDSCISLTGITIPNSVTTINYWAFQNCSSLTDITLPDSITNIGAYAFSNCSNLKTITIQASTPPSIVYTAFNGCPITTFYVPAASVDTYKSTSGWKSFASKIKAIGS